MTVVASQETAHRASTIMAAARFPKTAAEIQENVRILRLPNSAEIGVTYFADSAAEAVTGSNAMVDAYQQLMSQVFSDRYSAAIAAVSESLELARAESQDALNIGVDLGPETAAAEQISRIVAELQAINAAIEEGVVGVGLQALEAQEVILETELAALRTFVTQEVLAASDTVSLLAERLVKLEVDSRLEGDGVAFVTLAASATVGDSKRLLSAIGGAVLGASMGFGVAYLLYTRRYSIWSMRRAAGPIGQND